MKLTGFCLLLLAVVASVTAQAEDELHIPEETNNQFPPENNLETDINNEGSEIGTTEEPFDATVTKASVSPSVEDVTLKASDEIKPTETTETNNQFPPENNLDTDINNEGSEIGTTEEPFDVTVTKASFTPIVEDVQLKASDDIKPTETTDIQSTVTTETNNQFPPENNLDTDINIEGSEIGTKEELFDATVTTASVTPIMEDVTLIASDDIKTTETTDIKPTETTETNNQFPSENNFDTDINIEGSEIGTTEELFDATVTTASVSPIVEDVTLKASDEIKTTETTETNNQFPTENNLDTDINNEGSEIGTTEEPFDAIVTKASVSPNVEDAQLKASDDINPTETTDIQPTETTETNNQFPPENNLDTDINIEGSEIGTTEEPFGATVTKASFTPIVEDVQLKAFDDIKPTETPEVEESSCPKPCVCHVEGESSNFVVDCSDYGLTEFPTPIDVKTTTLNIQNNKLAEIPKQVSLLKNLKVLNADNNSIMDLALGSISVLPELTVLKLGNNRLIEYPTDLKNSFGLTKLEELDLGGNDIRTSLNRDLFSHFTSLKKLTLPEGAKDLVEDLCTSLKNTLVTVCTESCSTQSFECSDAPQNIEDDLLNVILPGTIALSSAFEDNANPGTSNDTKPESDKVDTTDATESNVNLESDPTQAVQPKTAETNTGDEFSLRSAVNKVPEGIAPMSTMVEAPKKAADDVKEADVAVGATTSGSNTGGVDKSVIGIIVAGMILVVAGITIKKNWSSIRKRFSSSPRAANERPGANANGTAQEEVPLQEKSPV